MDLKTITPVSTEAVTLTEAKSHLRIDGTAEDTYITSLITVAREYCETQTRRALASQTLELILDDFPNDYIELPKSPVQSITSIKYKNSDSVETTLTSYISDLDKVPALIMPEYGDSFPSFTPYPSGAIRIRYVAGHTTDIPKSIKQLS